MDEIRYEGYASGGIAVIVEALTDNRNRTALMYGRYSPNMEETLVKVDLLVSYLISVA